MKTLKLVSKIVFCSGLLTIGSVAHALTLLDVKIGTTTNNGGGDGVFQENGTAALGSATDWWNEFAYVSSMPPDASVVDSGDNALTGVTLTVTNSAAVGAKTTTTGINPVFLFNQAPYQNAGGVFTIALTGLAASTVYEFVGYAARTSSEAGGTWAVTVGTFDSGTTTNTGLSMNVTTGNGLSYAEFLANTNASGDLTITDSNNPSNAITILDGFQLETTAVPEPAMWALILGGGALCFAARRAKFGRAG